MTTATFALSKLLELALMRFGPFGMREISGTTKLALELVFSIISGLVWIALATSIPRIRSSQKPSLQQVLEASLVGAVFTFLATLIASYVYLSFPPDIAGEPVQIPDGKYVLKSAEAPDSCLSAQTYRNRYSSSAGYLTLVDCADHEQAVWIVEQIGSNASKLQHSDTGLCLDFVISDAKGSVLSHAKANECSPKDRGVVLLERGISVAIARDATCVRVIEGSTGWGKPSETFATSGRKSDCDIESARWDPVHQP